MKILLKKDHNNTFNIIILRIFIPDISNTLVESFFSDFIGLCG